MKAGDSFFLRLVNGCVLQKILFYEIMRNTKSIQLDKILAGGQISYSPVCL